MTRSSDTPIRPTIIYPQRSVAAGSHEVRERDLQALANLMDSAFEIPGLGVSFGLDAILGLVPGLGDAVTSLISMYIVGAARRMGVPRVTLARMTLNIVIDWLLGSVP